MALSTSGFMIRLTSDPMPNDYGGAGTMNGIDAVQRWKRGESYVKQPIAATMPDPIFNEIKAGPARKMCGRH